MKWRVKDNLRTCERCGCSDGTVEYCLEPYMYEIEDEEIMVNYCRECYNESADDI
jgi:hypothetical protein